MKDFSAALGSSSTITTVMLDRKYEYLFCWPKLDSQRFVIVLLVVLVCIIERVCVGLGGCVGP